MEAYASDNVLDVYRCLLEHPSMGADAVAVRLGVDSANVRSALDAMVKCGLLLPWSDEPTSAAALNPEVGLALLAERARARLAQQSKVFEATRERLGAFLQDVTSSKAGTQIEERVRGTAVLAQREVAVRGARSEIVALIPNEPGGTDWLAAFAGVELEVLERGVQLRVVYESNMMDQPAGRAYLDQLARAGGRCRVAPSLPLSLLITDETTAVLPRPTLAAPGGADEAEVVVLRHGSAATAMKALFELHWEAATPVESSTDWAAQTQGEATEAEGTVLTQRLVALLAAGAKDETVARALGVSVRTVRRIVADLMRDLGAQTRFEAGVAAGRAGWL